MSDDLYHEIKQLRQAIEQLEASPHYDEEFGLLYQSIQTLTEEVQTLQKARLIAQPEQLLNRIERASENRVKTVVQVLEQTQRQTVQAHQQLEQLVTQARERTVQNKLLILAFGFGLSVGSALMYVTGMFTG